MVSRASTPARRLLLPLLLLLLALALALGEGEAGQNLRKTTCPICNMDVKADINATVLGDQLVFACEMAGHIDALQNEPSAYLAAPEEVDVSTDVIYKDATDMTCPVCGKPFAELTHAVPWTPYGGQKIFACSAAHAQLIYSDPTSYVAKAAPSDGFCDAGSAADPRGSSMFDGFQLAIGGDATCALLLFQPWVLSSAAKYVFGLLGVVLLAMAAEGMGDLRDAAEKRCYRDYGIVFSQADYAALSTPVHSADSASRSSASFSDANTTLPSAAKVTLMRRIPLWCKLALAAGYAVHMGLAYLVMLVVMTYETLMFVAVIVGLGLGFVLFKDTEADVMGGNVDPCCST